MMWQCLPALIECEAGGESYTGMVAVGAVVVNRVNSGSFPNSVSGVIYQSGQFTPVATGTFQSVLARGARSDCYAAAQAALAGESRLADACISTAATAAESDRISAFLLKIRRGTFARG